MGQAPDIGSIVSTFLQIRFKYQPFYTHNHRKTHGSHDIYPILHPSPTASPITLHMSPTIRLTATDSQVTGTISRLAPQQATLLIQISNNKPVPESNEDFTGIIRLADIRLTERDKIKMGECFRLGDLVKARVVRLLFFLPYSPYSHPLSPEVILPSSCASVDP